MLKKYQKPQIDANASQESQVFPLVAPLAVMSAATASAAAVGAIAGAVAAKKLLKVSPDEKRGESLEPVVG